METFGKAAGGGHCRAPVRLLGSVCPSAVDHCIPAAGRGPRSSPPCLQLHQCLALLPSKPSAGISAGAPQLKKKTPNLAAAAGRSGGEGREQSGEPSVGQRCSSGRFLRPPSLRRRLLPPPGIHPQICRGMDRQMAAGAQLRPALPSLACRELACTKLLHARPTPRSQPVSKGGLRKTAECKY